MLIDNSYKAIAEGLLFIAESPMRVDELAKIMEIDERAVREVMTLLMEEYASSERGIVLREIGGGYQFSTAPMVAPYIDKIFSEKKTKLSHAAYETLAIIAYKQPVTRSQIEYIRGVKSDGPLQQLQARGLVEEKGRLEQPGRPVVFGTTTAFLVAFGLNKLEDLPKYDECQNFDFELKDAFPEEAAVDQEKKE
ncbi:MAG: SMC-Scp complex subunit ScpB [Peptococcaceae bacterium]|nr:SMC-Scp complex subunit ScpB [Peptococcaceae bacterium]